MNFKIQVEDDSEVIPKFVTDENTNFVQLYDWQRRALEFFFNNNNKVIFEVVTGAGKTFFAIEVLKQLLRDEPDLHTLIVVPKNVILETTWYKELYEAGISLRDIGVYYGGIKEYGKVTITNMQNIDRISLENFDLVIWDEIHNFGTARMLPYIKYPFKYKIGLSATLERRDAAHWEIMKAFEYNKFTYTPKEALADGVLNPFNFINIGVDLDDENYDKYAKLTTDLNLILKIGDGYNKIMMTGSSLKYKMLSILNERKVLVNNYFKKFEVVKILCDKHRDDKMIVFNEYNETTNKNYWYLLDIGVKSCIIHSGIEKDKRQQNLIDFRNDKYNIVLTSRVLDEGYNLPKLDVAIIAAGNSTSKQTIQRMGRVLRKKKKVSMLYQIYVKHTIEEEYAMERAKLFRVLCSNYKDYDYENEELVEK